MEIFIATNRGQMAKIDLYENYERRNCIIREKIENLEMQEQMERGVVSEEEKEIRKLEILVNEMCGEVEEMEL
jgi:hypothetical protein